MRKCTLFESEIIVKNIKGVNLVFFNEMTFPTLEKLMFIQR